MDWKDALGSLRQDLPEGSVSPADAPEPEKTQAPKLQVFYERKGRAGKPATIITGYSDEQEARSEASRLKQLLAVGGSARGCEVLLQGDQRARLEKILNKKK